MSLVNLFGARSLELRLRGFVKDLIAPGVQAHTDAVLQQFLSVSGSRTAGGVSFLIIMVSAGLLLRHLDAALNEIWAVRRKRPFLVSVGLYLGLLLGGPVVTALVLSGTTGLKRLILTLKLPFSSAAVQLGALVLAVVVLTLLYKVAPHAKVRWRSAWVGGVVAGSAWEVARHTYGNIASWALGANAIYGTLGIAPLFLMWLYVSWLIVLFGGRLSYAVEHAGFRAEFMELLAHPRARELLGARLAQESARAQLEGRPGPTVAQLAAQLDVPEQMLLDVQQQLETAGLVVRGKRGELAPARDPSRLTLADISEAVGSVGATVRRARDGSPSHYEAFEQLFREADETTLETLGRISWTNLASPSKGSEKT